MIWMNLKGINYTAWKKYQSQNVTYYMILFINSWNDKILGVAISGYQGLREGGRKEGSRVRKHFKVVTTSFKLSTKS